jgi:outer membrane protein TolC
MSVNQFSDLALRRSLRYRTYRNSLEAENFGYGVAWRATRLPVLGAAGSLGRSYSATSPTRSYANTTESSLSLDEPVYWTGGTFSVKGSRSTTRTDSAGAVTATRTEPSYAASYTQPLYLFVGDPRRRGWKKTELAHASALASFERERLSIWVEARRLYYLNVQKESELDLEKKTLESARSVLSTVEALVNAGKNAPVDLSRAEIRHQREQRRLKNAQTALEKLRNDILNFLQLPRGTTMRLTTTLTYEPFKKDVAELLEFSRAHRQDYLNARRSLEQAELSLKDIREEVRPNLSVGSSYNSSKTIPEPGLVDYARGWSVSGTLSMTLFNSGITRLKVEQANRSLENARLGLQDLERAIEAEVRNAFLDIKRLDEQVGDYEVNRKQVGKNLQAVRYRYTNGIDRLIDVFDAENEMRALELEFLGLLASYYTARDQLVLIVGGPLEGALP